MIDLPSAYDIVMESAKPLTVEPCPVDESLGRFLVEPIRARLDIPPFSKSAMDGYALPAGENRAEYRVIGTVAAGDGGELKPASGECVKIMTGAPLPAGCDRVVRVEYATVEGDLARFGTEEIRTNVVTKGENLRSGTRLLEPCRLRPFHLAMAAEQGITEFPVARRARAAVLSTGSELRRPGEALSPGQIYDSNGTQLVAQLETSGAIATFAGHRADDPDSLVAAMDEALTGNDLLILSGGVSMGDYDFVPWAFGELGVETLFHKIAVKPGKPTLFGRRGDTAVFGLPGNPVSSFVIFELLVRPYLYRRSGVEYRPRYTSGVLSVDVFRREADRREFLPVSVRQGVVTPVRYTGSTHLSALGDVDAFLELEQGVFDISKGTMVHARLL